MEVKGYTGPVSTSPRASKLNKMADRRAPKGKGKETDEFFHIRAKGHFLKVPVGQDLDDRVFVRAIGRHVIDTNYLDLSEFECGTWSYVCFTKVQYCGLSKYLDRMLFV